MSVNALNGIRKDELDVEPHGVIITEYPTVTSPNPKPLLHFQKIMIEDFLSADKLQNSSRIFKIIYNLGYEDVCRNADKVLSGKDDLSDVTSLSLQVDTAEASLGNLGELLVNLQELCFIDSCVASIRDLGSALASLTVLRMTRCSLNDVDGISMIPTLKELYVAYNDINDLSPLSMLDNLKVIDLEGNNINDIAQVEFLSLCCNLEALVLTGNPVQRSPQPNMRVKNLKFYNYKQAVLSILPNLIFLDGIQTACLSIEDDDKSVTSDVNDELPQEDYTVVHDSIKSITNQHNYTEKIEDNSGKASVLVLSRPRPMTALPRLTLEKEIDSSSWVTDEITSLLTHGSQDIYCGNAGRSLRKRSKKIAVPSSEIRSNTPKNNEDSEHCLHQSNHSEEIDEERDVLFEELRQWRQKFEEKSASIYCNDTRRIPTPPQGAKPKRPQTASAILGRQSPHRKTYTGS